LGRFPSLFKVKIRKRHQRTDKRSKKKKDWVTIGTRPCSLERNVLLLEHGPFTKGVLREIGEREKSQKQHNG